MLEREGISTIRCEPTEESTEENYCYESSPTSPEEEAGRGSPAAGIQGTPARGGSWYRTFEEKPATLPPRATAKVGDQMTNELDICTPTCTQ